MGNIAGIETEQTVGISVSRLLVSLVDFFVYEWDIRIRNILSANKVFSWALSMLATI